MDKSQDAVKSMVLIDGHSLIYQSFYAIRDLSSPTGEPTNAVFGFLMQLRKVLDRKPAYLAVALDAPGKTFRHAMYADYKATRKPMPEELRVQIPMIKELLSGYGVTVVSREGFEADDVIATLAQSAEKEGISVVICTTDKDAEQLISDKVRVLELRKDQLTDVEGLRQKKGITPEQVTEVLGLGGDSSDNIPGVPGIGPKTATELINRYGTLEGVLTHVDEIAGAKRQENLRNYAEQARMSRELAKLDSTVPLEVSLDALKVREPDRKVLLDLFGRWGFRKFTEELLAEMPERKMTYHVVDSEAAFAEFLKQLDAQKEVSVDLETTSVNPVEAEIVGLSFSWREQEGYYLPLRGPLGSRVLDGRKTLQALKPMLEDSGVGKVGQNLKYDSLVLAGAGISLKPIAFDTMVASYTINPGRQSHSLDSLAQDHLGRRKQPITELIGTGRKQICMDQVPVQAVSEYAIEDAELAWCLTGVLREQLIQGEFENLYREVELPLIQVLRDMELVGIRVDTKLLGEMSEAFGGRLEELKKDIYAAAGREFNIDSPKQLGQVLFEELKLPTRRKTKSGFSTDQEVLESLAALHPLPKLVLEHRGLSKLKSTYLDALPKMVNAKTGRIHASFNQTVTSTGRLSSSEPNLQNIPVRTEEGGRIRRAFVPGERDQVLLSADYSQIELRLLAHLSGDPALVRAFNEGRDIHAFVASQVNDVALDEVTPEMRRHAKAVNFGIMYGLSPYGLSQQLGISGQEAQQFIEDYFRRYRGVAEFMRRLLSETHQKGYTTSVLGRRFYVSGVREPGTDGEKEGYRQLNAAERFAVNSTCQGSAAELIKLAMIGIHHELSGRPRTRMLLQIHDELVFEVPKNEVDDLTEIVQRQMTGVLTLRVPLVVNVGVGLNWLEVK